MINCFTAVFFLTLHGLLLYCSFSFMLSITKSVTIFSVCIISVTSYSNLCFCSVLLNSSGLLQNL